MGTMLGPSADFRTHPDAISPRDAHEQEAIDEAIGDIFEIRPPG